MSEPLAGMVPRELRPFLLPGIEVAPAKVLIVDDDRDVAKTLARTIERLPGVEAVVATSRAEAFDMACEERFDLALVDLGIEAKGVDLLLAIRDASPDTRRVLLSAWADESIAEGGAVFCGAHAYVLKPWDTEILRVTLEKLLRPKMLRIASGPMLN